MHDIYDDLILRESFHSGNNFQYTRVIKYYAAIWTRQNIIWIAAGIKSKKIYELGLIYSMLKLKI